MGGAGEALEVDLGGLIPGCVSRVMRESFLRESFSWLGISLSGGGFLTDKRLPQSCLLWLRDNGCLRMEGLGGLPVKSDLALGPSVVI